MWCLSSLGTLCNSTFVSYQVILNFSNNITQIYPKHSHTKIFWSNLEIKPVKTFLTRNWVPSWFFILPFKAKLRPLQAPGPRQAQESVSLRSLASRKSQRTCQVKKLPKLGILFRTSNACSRVLALCKPLQRLTMLSCVYSMVPQYLSKPMFWWTFVNTEMFCAMRPVIKVLNSGKFLLPGIQPKSLKVSTLFINLYIQAFSKTWGSKASLEVSPSCKVGSNCSLRYWVPLSNSLARFVNFLCSNILSLPSSYNLKIESKPVLNGHFQAVHPVQVKECN